MPSFKDLAKSVDELILGSSIGSAGFFICLASLPAGLIVATTGAAIVGKKFIESCVFLKQQKKLRRLLSSRGQETASLLKELHDGEQLVFAIFYENGKLGYSILGHKDPIKHAQLEQRGIIIPLAAVYARADGEAVEIVGY